MDEQLEVNLLKEVTVMSNLAKILLGSVVALVAGGAIRSFGPSLGQWGILLPMLILCPLMHLFMMRGMHGSHCKRHEADPGESSPSSSDSTGIVSKNPRSNSCH